MLDILYSNTINEVNELWQAFDVVLRSRRSSHCNVTLYHYMFVSQHPADHVDSSEVGAAATEEAQPAGGVNDSIASTATT